MSIRRPRDWLAAVRSYGADFFEKPENRFLAAALGLASSVVGLYQFFGAEVGVAGATLLLAYYVRDIYRRIRRMRDTEERLLSELPHQHAFLVEFLRQTYALPDYRGIPERNAGLLIHSYRNDFVVRGTDCSNRQLIDGTNASDRPVIGVTFALVGGSSTSADELGSRYRVDDGPPQVPEFSVDDDRLKVVVNPFRSPLEPGRRFLLEYTDEWKGSMRKTADGFFFPEALYFPGGIHRLCSRLDFSYVVQSIAVLEVDITRAIVQTSGRQPERVEPMPGLEDAYEWYVDSPSPGKVYVIYYRA